MDFLVFLGPPGSGKGTQAQILAQESPKVCHVSTGQILRDEISSGSEFGKILESYVSNGQLITDQMMFKILETALSRMTNFSTILLDGVPRTLYQADLLDDYLKKTGSSLKKVVYFDIGDDILVERLSGRYSCASCGASYHKVSKKPVIEGQCDSCKSTVFEQRRDDTMEVVQKRLAVYHEQTQPLVDYYIEHGLLVKIDATESVESVSDAVNFYLK